jgi:uncharacterized protein
MRESREISNRWRAFDRYPSEWVMKGKVITSLFLLLLVYQLTWADSSSPDFHTELISGDWEPWEVEQDNSREPERSFHFLSNSLRKLPFTGAIRFYQRFITQQDNQACQFYPSCSHFGFQAVAECGAIQGILMTSDRLLRCNSWASGHYPVRKGFLRDPISGHVLWNKSMLRDRVIEPSSEPAERIR